MTCLLEQDPVDGHVEEFKMTHGEAGVDIVAESVCKCEAQKENCLTVLLQTKHTHRSPSVSPQ